METFAWRLALNATKYSYITLLLYKLHWLPVQLNCTYIYDYIITFQSHNHGLAPAFIRQSNLLAITVKPGQAFQLLTY